jgi:glycosyltransferase involved in cell wall biosynthesis
MSAFSCGPGGGSEPSVGWNIPLEAARLGHEVLVLTQTEFQAEIEQELAAGTLPANLRFDIFMPGWLERLRDAGLRSGFHSLTWHMVSVLWQICVFFHVRRYYKRAEIDLIHHVSLSGIRYPTLLTLLGLPTVVGPIGGGETAPMALRKSFPWKDWCTEIVRDVHNRALRADPITRSAFRRATLIVLRTKESLIAVPPRFRSKVYVTVGMGVAEPQEENLLPRAPGPRAPGESLRLMYAARLLYWKGGHLALKALANARARGANATLTVIGDGRARRDFERLAGELGVAAYVTWTGTVSHQELLTIYRGHHVFLFPSLHDAGGTVVLEAWGNGLPVVCLALGGPGMLVDETCGRVVSVVHCSEDECVAKLGTEIVALAANDSLRLALSRGAIVRYRDFSWANIVSTLYAEIDRRLQHEATSVFPAVRSAAAAPHTDQSPSW